LLDTVLRFPELQLPALALKEFDATNITKEQFQTFTEYQYCVPNVANFGAGDSIVQNDKIFQMTVGKDHPIVMARLADIVKALAETNATIHFYFVVPSSAFETLKLQPLHNADGKVAEKLSDVCLKRVIQYALCLPLSIDDSEQS